MSKTEQTKAHIIARSAPVFNKKGYAGTSLSDIMKATGLSKGSVYGNFSNKDELAVAVYDYNFYSLRKRIAQDVLKAASALDKLLAITGYYRNHWKQVNERGGCPILNASVEADDHLAYLKKPVQHSVKLFVKDISYIIRLGQDSGEFRRQADANAYAYQVLTLLEGGMMLMKTMNNHQLLLAALDRIETIIRQELQN